MDVSVDGDSYLIELIVPGLVAEDIEIEIVEKTIEIQGEFKAPEEDVKFLRKERPSGKFRRLIRLRPNSLYWLVYKLWKGWAIKNRMFPFTMTPREYLDSALYYMRIKSQ